ncbi:BLUF domain-containing protein [Nonlabens antarcticus]|uniref:BLUF domain-containing protein n=1 Tax=Nonlabens antarcticus TaxID=392714 RepID=UPI0018917F37|nr:BLUF domain-containing protein [Nonlabens antarcticus]
MNSFYTICYISRADEALSHFEINDMLQRSSECNNENGIKGILLFNRGNFLQVLEGAKENLVALYEKIAFDKRHDTVYEIYHGATEYATFLNYNAQFNLLEKKTDLIALKEYLRRNCYSGTDSELVRKLEPFLSVEHF